MIDIYNDGNTFKTRTTSQYAEQYSTRTRQRTVKEMAVYLVSATNLVHQYHSNWDKLFPLRSVELKRSL